ncbi:MAG: hypothetical protein JXR78_09300 [Victivallales bacterium]|nr:hypothetical protein [Victivallales bacterium]
MTSKIMIFLTVALFSGANLAAFNVITPGAGDTAVEHVNSTLEHDARGVPNYRINPPEGSSRIVFTIPCDATAQNYITVRFKGGESRHERLYLADAEGNIFHAKVNSDLVILDDPSSNGIRPGGWFYVTAPVPVELTRGKQQVKLSIVSRGRNKGYANRKSDYEQTMPSRGIYRIYSHAGEMFVPQPDDSAGEVISPYTYGDYKPLSAGTIRKIREHMIKVADDQAQHTMNNQLYSPDWRKKVSSGKWPGAMVGGFFVRSIPKSGKYDLQKVKDDTAKHYIYYNNLGPYVCAEILSYVYNMKESKFYKSREVLERIALGLDYARRSQGGNGGYVDVWEKRWVGGPERRWGSGSLEGFTHGSLGRAFVAVYDDLKQTGMLNEKIDDDASDKTAPVTRLKAYVDLFSMSVDFLKDKNGHAPNQDSMNVLGIFPQVQALRLLAPDKRFDFDAQVRKRVLGTTGLGHKPGEFTWVTPRGLSLEPRGSGYGGYTCEYGQNQPEEYLQLARYSGIEDVLKVAEKAAYTYPRFWYPVYHADGRIDMRAEGFINWRNCIRNGKNIEAGHGGALELKNPYCIRAFQLKIMNGELSDLSSFKPVTKGGHHFTMARHVMQQAANTVKLLSELSAAKVRLPHEHGQPDFAWADELAQAVAVKYGDKYLFATLNWRHPADKANGFARFHFLSPEFETMATTVIKNVGGQYGLNVCRYGDVFIALNNSLNRSYNVKVPDDFIGENSRELIGGGKVKSMLVIAPQTSAVIVKYPADK